MQIEVGQFGKARFPTKKNGYRRFWSCAGDVIEVTDKIVKFKDHDNYVHVINKDEFDFTPLKDDRKK